MSKKREEAEQSLINATIQCIEKYGLKNTTIRNIASEANINSSAINYYFKSRTELLKKVMDITIENAINFDDVAINENDSYKEALKKILTDWYDGAIKFPGISKAHFDDIQNNIFIGAQITQKINQFIDDVYSLLVKHGLDDQEINKTKINIIFGIFIGNLTMPKLVSFNLDTSSRDAFIDQLIEIL